MPGGAPARLHQYFHQYYGYMLRIAIDLSALLPEATGVDNYMLSLVEHLGRIDRTNRYRIVINHEDRARLADRVPDNFTLVPLSRRPHAARLLCQQVALPLHVRMHGVEVVHSPSFIMPLIRGRAAHVLSIHDMTSFTRPDDHIALRRSAPYRWAVQASIRRADLVLVPSRHTERMLRREISNDASIPIEVIPYGVGEEFEPGSIADAQRVTRRLGLPESYVLYVGTIEPRKNLGRLVEAYRRLIEQTDVAEDLVLVGRLGWQFETLLAQIQDPALRGRVHHVGYVAPADLPAIYRAATLFVYPSLEEGFGFPPLEAMACGVPTISSASSSLGENLSGAARLVDSEDAAAMAGAMRDLLADEQERSRLSALGRERAGEFTWEMTARRTLSAYERVAGIRRAGSGTSMTERVHP